MKQSIPPSKMMSILELSKLVSIALVNLLVLIAILLLVPLGSMTSGNMGPTSDLLAMAGTILLTLMIVVNCINSVRLIRTWKPSSTGGKETSIEHCKNSE